MQQINLYVQELRPKRNWLSARYILVAFSIFMFSLVFLYWVNIQEYERLQLDREEKLLVLKGLEEELDRTKSGKKKSSKDDIEREISDLQLKVYSRERLVNLIQGQSMQAQFSFHAAIYAMAKSSSDRLSLDRFTFSESGRRIEMRGVAAMSYDVPEYLGKLKKEKVFENSQFGLMAITGSRQDGNVSFVMGYDRSNSLSARIDAENAAVSPSHRAVQP
jgi:hypothetical protein